MRRVESRRIMQRAYRRLPAIVACIGFASTLAAQERLIQRTEPRSIAVSTANASSPIEASPASRTPIRRDNPGGAEAAEQPGSGSLWGSFVTLGLILGGLYVALRLLRRFSPASAASPRAGLIEVIATRRLDAQSAVHVVRIGPRVLAVGASPSGLTTLSTFEDPAEIDRWPADGVRAPTIAPLFNGSRAVRRAGPVPAESRPEPPVPAASLTPKPVRGGPHD